MVAVTCALRARRAADLTRGRRLYACPRSGGLPRSTALARWSRREGSPESNPLRPGDFPGFRGPFLPFAPAGLIPDPAKDRRSRSCYGHHPQGRPPLAPALLRQRHARRGRLIKELAEYLGHSDPAFTLRVYVHMLPCSHDRARAAINERFTWTAQTRTEPLS
jgi:integrase